MHHSTHTHTNTHTHQRPRWPCSAGTEPHMLKLPLLLLLFGSAAHLTCGPMTVARTPSKSCLVPLCVCVLRFVCACSCVCKHVYQPVCLCVCFTAVVWHCRIYTACCCTRMRLCASTCADVKQSVGGEFITTHVCCQITTFPKDYVFDPTGWILIWNAHIFLSLPFPAVVWGFRLGFRGLEGWN